MAQRKQNNRELVKSTGDPYDDTLKLTMSFVNKLTVSNSQRPTTPNNRTDVPSTSKVQSENGATKKSPESKPLGIKNPQSDSQVQIRGHKGLNVSKKSNGNVLNRFVKLMTLSRGKVNESNHSCRERSCGRCNLMEEDYLANK